MDTQQKADNAASFGQAAQAYERGRPSYPNLAVGWLLPDYPRHVLDLAAGTGKLTRLLVDRGLDVTAVEPSEGMLTQLTTALPTVRALIGTAEQIPLPDGGFDAVLVGQAWHWVDPEKAVPEVARVLRPCGQLGIVWNRRDDRVGWVADLSEVLRSVDRDAGRYGVNDLGPEFGPMETFEVPWRHRMTPDALIDLVRSRSYVITSSPQEQEATLNAVARLLAEHPELKGRDSFDLPYVAQCFRFMKQG